MHRSSQSRRQEGKRSPSRRRFLQATLGAGGFGLGLGEILRLRAASTSSGGASPPDTAVIQVWLGGGPSQFETFDPKPDAPLEIRGPYGLTRTKLPGVIFSDNLPRTAQVVDRAAILRTVTHPDNNHATASASLTTGYADTSPESLHPSVGSVVSRLRGPNRPGLPAYVHISHEQERNLDIGAVHGAGYLSSSHAPFTVMQDPYHNGYREDLVRPAIVDFELANDVTLARVADRRTLLEGFDRFRRHTDTCRSMHAFDDFQRAAMDIVTSGAAQRAFDLSEESAKTHALYGPHRWGKMALLSRRLVEAGATFVTLNTAPDSLCWDWHLNLVNDKRPADGSQGPSRGMDVSGPPLDQMISALVTDLYQRGLDRKVLLLVWGEFGRTPRINKTGGRDHWGPLMSILLAGGGLKVGQVIGTSNRYGEEPSRRPVPPADVLTMVYRHLGIAPQTHTANLAGRPFPVLPDGRVISELL